YTITKLQKASGKLERAHGTAAGILFTRYPRSDSIALAACAGAAFDSRAGFAPGHFAQRHSPPHEQSRARRPRRAGGADRDSRKTVAGLRAERRGARLFPAPVCFAG